MVDRDWAIRVSDLGNPTSEISEALTQHAEAAVTEVVGPQVEAAQSAASAAQTSAASAANNAASASAAANTATTMAAQTTALQDGAVKSLIADEDSDTRTELNVVMDAAARVFGPRLVADGDSIMIGNIVTSAEQQDRAAAWIVDFSALTEGRINLLINAAVGGQRTDQALARFDDYVAPHAPDTVLLACGTNDVSQGRTLEQWISSLDSYLAKCVAIGARLVVGGIYPKNQTVTQIAEWNSALVAWGDSNGVPVIPFWLLADTDGSWPDGWSTDGTHPLGSTPALAEIARLAWETIEPRVGTRALPAAVSPSALIPNGQFTTQDAQITATVTVASLTETTGTLPPGVYEYRVVAGNDWHRALAHDDKSITLSAAAGVTVTKTHAGTFSRWLIFRKGPGESLFRFMTSVTSGTSTWTDDGSLSPLWDWRTDNTVPGPTGLLGATGGPYSLGYGPRVFAEPGIRGNVLRVTGGDRAASAWEVYLPVTGLVAGDHLDVTLKLRGPVSAPTGKVGKVYLRWRDASSGKGNTILWSQWLDARWREIHFRALVPAGATQVRLSFAGDDTWPYLDVAECSITPAVG